MENQHSNMKEQVIWEEKNSIEQVKNSTNNPIIGQKDITNEIKKKSAKNECENTGKKWIKNCPDCGIEMSYSSRCSLSRSIRDNCKCGTGCRSLKPSFKNGWSKSCPSCNKIQIYRSKKSLDAALEDNKICKKCTQALRKPITPLTGWIRTCEGCNHIDKYQDKRALNRALERTKKCRKCNKLSDSHWSRKCPICNCDITYISYDGFVRAEKNNSKCVKCKYIFKRIEMPPMGWIKECPECKGLQKYTCQNSLRIAMERNTKCNDCTKKICGKYLPRAYSPIACEFMNAYGKRNGYKFQHAICGGEYQVGRFFLDGYDKVNNVVFEYDEPYHYKDGKLKDKDLERQAIILKFLNPSKFIRYNEQKKVLTEIISGEEIKL